MIEKTLTILKSKKNNFENDIEKFNKKALKLGTSPMIVEWGKDVIRSFYKGVLIRLQEVTVKYEIPKIAGWDLVCIFDYEYYVTENGEETMAVFTNAVPEKIVPAKYQNKTEIHCEHCGHNRYRKKSFLVQHESGEYKEVGSTCLKDFLGHDPQNFLWFATMEDRIGGLEEEFGMGSFGSSDIAYDLLGILTMTNAMIKKYSWKSRGETYDTYKIATADMVLEYLTNPKTEIEIEIEEDDKEIAAKTIEYFRILEEEDNDYIMNCKKVIKLNVVPARRFGIACSMLIAYKKHIEKEIQRANEKSSEWFGDIGSKLEDCEVTCTFKTHVESYYGTSTLYKFVDNNGNIFKTFYSGYTWNVKQGEKAYLWGTVKKHDEWNDKKETLLTRCKVKID